LILGSKITKTSRRRVVNLSENALAWLLAFRDQPLSPRKTATDTYRTLQRLVEKAGIIFPSNALRASAATYLLMKSENAGSASLQLGHSIRELETVYFRPSLKAVAEKWFEIYPSPKNQEENAKQDT
jgi:hypothetical protein